MPLNEDPTLDEIIRNIPLHNRVEILGRLRAIESGAFTTLERKLAKRIEQLENLREKEYWGIGW